MSIGGNSKESSSNPAVLLHTLVSKVSGLHGDAATPLYRFAINVTGSNISHMIEHDEFHIVENIKKYLVKSRSDEDAATFAEFHRKLLATPVLKNRWAILCLLYELKNESGPHVSKAAILPKGISGTMVTLSGNSEGMLDATPLPTIHKSNPSLTIDANLKSSAMTEFAITSANAVRSTAVSGRVAALRSYWQASPTTPNSKLQLLKRNVDLNANRPDSVDNFSSDVSEAALLREIIYALQGIEGKVIHFGGGKDDIWIDPKAGIKKPTRQFLLKLAELGWLYKKICKYCDARCKDESMGLVGKSFVAALHHEMMEYYRLLAVLEAQLQQEEEQGIASGFGGMTFRRLRVWTVESFIRLKELAALVDICKGIKGGALASAVHSYLQHGDHYVRNLVKNVLAQVSVPIYGMVHRWIIDGELEDFYQEFFVAKRLEFSEDDDLWHEKYSFRKSMVPSFLSMNQASKIFSTGKSIDFLRQVCLDRTSLQGREAIRASLEKTSVESLFIQDHDGELQTLIDMAYREASRHVLNVMHTTYKLMDHLKAVRRYLLLGQGDFIRHFMDLLECDLNKPAHTLYLHSLSAILETAIRSTNAQFDDPDILQRLDVSLLEISVGDTGWDVFSLVYHMNGPIGTVFTKPVMLTYLRLFNALWRAKRMEYVLSSLWKSQMTNWKILMKMPEVVPILHQCHMLISEMVHFVQQMQYYITFEVMECSWDVLEKKVKSAEDLDQVIAAHEEFLEMIMTRALLDNGSTKLLNQLRATYDLIIQFQNIHDQFAHLALLEFDLRFAAAQQVERPKKDKGRSVPASVDGASDLKRRQEFVKDTVSKTKSQLRILATSYQDMVQKFLLMLTSHSDVSLQFLSFRLDFNEIYKRRDSRLHVPLTYQHHRRLSAGGSGGGHRTTSAH